MTCSLCGKEILGPDEKLAWKQMVSWVSPKGAKGSVGAKPTGAFAHAGCVALVRAKVSVEQSSLF